MVLIWLPLRLAFESLDNPATAPRATLYADIAQAAALLMTSVAGVGIAAWSAFRTGKMQREIEMERRNLERSMHARERVEAALKETLGREWHVLIERAASQGKTKLESITRPAGVELATILSLFPKLRSRIENYDFARDMERWQDLDPEGHREYEAEQDRALDAYIENPDNWSEPGQEDAEFVGYMRERFLQRPKSKASLTDVAKMLRFSYR
jgi:hypothetical protein